MDFYEFDDALTGASIACGFPDMAARVASGPGIGRAESIFFPGCSFVNYMTPLVKSVNDLLVDAGEVQGISLLCCGKILEYEPDGQAVRSAYEEDFRTHVAAAGVKRIVAACPNCVLALRTLLAADEKTAGVEVVPLTKVLVDLGRTVDPDVARRMVADAHRAHPYGSGDEGGAAQESASADRAAQLDAGRDAVFVVHDSCPDRDTGEFADATRAILGEGRSVDQAHCRARSLCCGSRVRATGRFEGAVKLAQRNGQESEEAGGDAIVTPCVSCAYLLSALQKNLPVFHYLELLYDWRVDWEQTEEYMKLRFLFDVEDMANAAASSRTFVAIGDAGDPASYEAAEATVGADGAAR